MKLNGFENYIITEAVNYYKDKAEKEVAKLEKANGKDGKTCLIAILWCVKIYFIR